jgi:hypothetical protein
MTGFIPVLFAHTPGSPVKVPLAQSAFVAQGDPVGAVPGVITQLLLVQTRPAPAQTPPAQQSCPSWPQGALTHRPAVHTVVGSLQILPVQQF